MDKKQKALIIGANGFLGRKLIIEAAKMYDVIAADINFNGFNSSVPKIQIDISDIKNVNKVYSEIHPELTILTAAVTNVDYCEENKEKTYQINTIGPQNIGKVIEEIGGRLIFISTDFVFDGIKGNYNEKDTPNPISVYGKSKFDAEQKLLQLNIPLLICRTSVLYGWPDSDQKDNFFSWAYKELKKNTKLRIVTNQINTPTFVDDLSKFLATYPSFKSKEILHTTGPEVISRYQYVEKIIDFFKFDKSQIEPVESIVQKAKRPINADLNTELLKSKNNFLFRNLNESFEALKSQIIQNPH